MVRTALKWTGRAIALVLVAIAIEATAFVFYVDTINFNKIVSGLSAEVGSELGRKVEVDGPVRANLWTLRPALTIENVRIANAPWGSRDTMIAVGRFHLQLKLLPLLRGVVQIKRVVIEKPDILLEVDKNGQYNWNFVEAPDPTGSEADDPWFVERLRIEDAKIQIRDGKTRTSDTFRVNLLKFKQRNPEAPLTMRLDGSVSGRPAHLALSIRSPVELIEGVPTAVDVTAKLGRTDFSANLKAAIADKLTVAGTLTSRIFDLSDFEGKPVPKGRRRLVRRTLTASQVLAIDPRTLALLRYVSSDVRVTMRSVRAQGQSLGSVSARLRIDKGIVSASPVALRFKGGQVGGTVRLQPTGAVRFALRSRVGKQTFRVQGSIGRLNRLLAGQPILLSFAINKGKSDLSGRIRVRSGRQLVVTGSLASKRLDIKDFEGLADGTEIDSDQNLADLLKNLSVKLDYRAGRLIVEGVPISNVRLPATVNKGVLTVGPLRASVFGGPVTGRARLNSAASPPTLAVSMAIRGGQLSQLMKDEKGIKKSDQLYLTARLAGSGTTLDRVLASTSGSVAVMAGSEKAAKDLDIVSDLGTGFFKSVGGIIRLRAGDVRCVVAAMDFRNGLGKSRLLLIDTEALSLFGDGKVDLRNKTVDLYLVPSKKILYLRAIKPFVIRYRGPLANAKTSVDVGAAAAETIKGIVMTTFTPIRLLAWAFGAEPGLRFRTNPCPKAIETIYKRDFQ